MFSRARIVRAHSASSTVVEYVSGALYSVRYPVLLFEWPGLHIRVGVSMEICRRLGVQLDMQEGLRDIYKQAPG